MTVAIRFRLLFTCHRWLCLYGSRVHKQVFVSVFESLTFHAVHLSAKVDAVGAGLFVFHFQNLHKKSNKRYCSTENIAVVFFLENYKILIAEKHTSPPRNNCAHSVAGATCHYAMRKGISQHKRYYNRRKTRR